MLHFFLWIFCSFFFFVDFVPIFFFVLSFFRSSFRLAYFFFFSVPFLYSFFRFYLFGVPSILSLSKLPISLPLFSLRFAPLPDWRLSIPYLLVMMAGSVFIQPAQSVATSWAARLTVFFWLRCSTSAHALKPVSGPSLPVRLTWCRAAFLAILPSLIRTHGTPRCALLAMREARCMSESLWNWNRTSVLRHVLPGVSVSAIRLGLAFFS